jgi:trimeric autotransporter adhesin
MTDAPKFDKPTKAKAAKKNGRGASSPIGRRGLLLGATAAGAGVAGGLVVGATSASAADGGPVLLGESNKETATTKIKNKAATAFEAGSTANASANNQGIGVYGTSLAGYGVRGDSSGLFAGVGGYAAGTGGSGVYGQGNGSQGFGVYGYAPDGISVYAQGNATVTGTLSKGGGSFRIDHPLDPEGKYLYHSFVESPDMMNVYNGTVTLGPNGRAKVHLPDWFEALNRDYRYQLTAIGQPAPDLHVSKEVSGGRFTIAGGKPGQRVSWQVTGIRHDAWADANRIPVEVDKSLEDQGRYLHPELFDGEPITEIAGNGERPSMKKARPKKRASA